MSSATALEMPDRNLDHIYFFIHSNSSASRPSTSSSEIVSPNRCNTPRSEAGSLGSNETEATTAVSQSSSSGSLNPAAKEFTPSSSPRATKTKINAIEVRQTADHGYGVFATRFIPIGTRVICEAPLLRISENHMHLAVSAYENLPSAKKTAFDKLHCFKPDIVDFEQVSRFNLIDHSGDTEDDEIDRQVAEHARIMGTFAANSVSAGSGLAVFETASRLNHSCVPNVHHSYNPTLRKQTVHAVRDIKPDEELCTTYLGGPGNYQICPQRIENLRANYGFTCTCAACSNPDGSSDSRRQLMANLAWGLQQYLERNGLGMSFVPTSSAEALAQSEAFIHLLLEEGLFSAELMKAYRTASTQALNMGMFPKAMDYAKQEAEVERNCLGKELNDLVQLGVASSCWIDTVKAAAAATGATLGKGGKYNKKSTKPAKTPEQRAKKKESKKKSQAKKREAREQQMATQMAAERARKEVERKQKEYEEGFPALSV